ncbi:hypothetical protein LWI29_027673 [Acer saccharum]|uniref:U-box domain-containing protein n=1 Tax=Acer saccharum TaxID=4024 RepID=A0AA39RWI3_ACESA|nr:hypothetical protein LWI29_027673 [Acer saccharum]
MNFRVLSNSGWAIPRTAPIGRETMPIRRDRSCTECTCLVILLAFAIFMAALIIFIAIVSSSKKKDRNCLDCQEHESFGLEEIADLIFSHYFFPDEDHKLAERYNLLIAHKEELGQLISLEQGKLLKEAIGEALESEAVMGRFHAVYDKLNQALDDVSYNELGVSVEVKEQVELMCKQLQRAKRRTDTEDIELAMDLMVIFSKKDNRNADSILKWLNSNNRTCPKTRQSLDHLSLAQNYALRNLIVQWCEKNDVELPKKDSSVGSDGSSAELIDEISSLVQNLLSSHLHTRREAAVKLLMLSKENPDNTKWDKQSSKKSQFP